MLSAVADWIGQAACHQIPTRSFHVNGEQLSVCGRCAGLYYGFIAGYLQLFLRGKIWATAAPTGTDQFLLFIFLAFMPIDAVLINKIFNIDSGNVLRYSVGVLFGLPLPFFLQPLVANRLNPSSMRPSFSGRVDRLLMLTILSVMTFLFLPTNSLLPFGFYQLLIVIGSLLFLVALNGLTALYLISPTLPLQSATSRLGLAIVCLALSFAEIEFAHVLKQWLL